MRVFAGLAAASVLTWCAFAAHAQPAPATSPTAVASASPQAIIDTDYGRIVIALDRANAPKSVANFIAYARAGHFDGTMVYRAVPSFVIQMGSYEPGGIPRPAAAHVALESANGLHNVRGAVAVARHEDPNSGTAEFFIDLTDLPALDADPAAPPNTTGYAVFGHITQGMDVAERIAAAPKGGKGPFPPGATPLIPVLIKKVTIVEASSASPPPAMK